MRTVIIQSDYLNLLDALNFPVSLLRKIEAIDPKATHFTLCAPSGHQLRRFPTKLLKRAVAKKIERLSGGPIEASPDRNVARIEIDNYNPWSYVANCPLLVLQQLKWEAPNATHMLICNPCGAVLGPMPVRAIQTIVRRRMEKLRETTVSLN